jgi:hypothetical protein
MLSSALLLLAAAIPALMPSAARAAPVLDQSWDPPGQSVIQGGVGSFAQLTVEQAQSLAVGVSGYLAQVAVLVELDGRSQLPTSVNLSIYRISGSDYFDGSGVLLGGGTFVLDQFLGPFWKSVSFGETAVPVTAGDRLAIVMSSSGLTLWCGDLGDGYSGGQGSSIANTYDPVAWKRNDYDLRFRTFVVPEPHALVLLAASLLALCASRRRSGMLGYLLAALLGLVPAPSRAGIYQGFVSKRIDNKNWILVVDGKRYFVEMSLCLSLAMEMGEVIVKSAGAQIAAGDEVIFVDDKDTCTVGSATKLNP